MELGEDDKEKIQDLEEKMEERMEDFSNRSVSPVRERLGR